MDANAGSYESTAAASCYWLRLNKTIGGLQKLMGIVDGIGVYLWRFLILDFDWFIVLQLWLI